MESSWRLFFIGIIMLGVGLISKAQNNLPYSEIRISGVYSCHNYGFEMLIKKQKDGYVFIDKTANKNDPFSKMLEPYELVLVNQFLEHVKMYRAACPEEEVYGGSFHKIRLDKEVIKLNDCNIDSLGTLTLRYLLRPDIFKYTEELEREKLWRINSILRDSVAREFEGAWTVNKGFKYEVGEVLALTKTFSNDSVSDGVWGFRNGGLKPFGNDSLNNSVTLFERNTDYSVADYEKWFLNIKLISEDQYILIIERNDAINFTDEEFEHIPKQGIIRLEFKEIYNSKEIKLLELILVE